ncbi:hypothetical protein CANCADRAFT_45300 [Tortispora caseinolytica NRRL Y-17796]|uniref:Uncharacterized protein n=1 Tax=Tortispora caseinolytica NRRL Y-17796 TaxID=767744 RepID=A0A1E4TAM9_9ASCO|nr:hypothetical protein CANCADRAFT_45300 [Tortispora caseinolytica NRRL Y-17796]
MPEENHHRKGSKQIIATSSKLHKPLSHGKSQTKLNKSVSLMPLTRTQSSGSLAERALLRKTSTAKPKPSRVKSTTDMTGLRKSYTDLMLAKQQPRRSTARKGSAILELGAPNDEDGDNDDADFVEDSDQEDANAQLKNLSLDRNVVYNGAPGDMIPYNDDAEYVLASVPDSSNDVHTSAHPSQMTTSQLTDTIASSLNKNANATLPNIESNYSQPFNATSNSADTASASGNSTPAPSAATTQELSPETNLTTRGSAIDVKYIPTAVKGAVQTRTQQRLWLQRASIKDMSNRKDHSFLNAKLIREIEKATQDYESLRRFTNPVVAAIERLYDQGLLDSCLLTAASTPASPTVSTRPYSQSFDPPSSPTPRTPNRFNSARFASPTSPQTPKSTFELSEHTEHQLDLLWRKGWKRSEPIASSSSTSNGTEATSR